MAIGRWFSFGFGIIAATAFVATVIAAQRLNASPLVTAAAAGGAGLALGLAHWAVAWQWDAGIRNLVRHIESLGRPAGKREPFEPSWGQQALGDVVSRTFGSLSRKVESLEARRRELDIELRIADADREHTMSILNTIADAVIVTDSFNEVALANDAAARVLGLQSQDALRKPIDRVVTDATLIKLIKDTCEGGEVALRRHVEHRFGTDVHAPTYDVTLSCLHDGASTAVAEKAGVVTILRDVTREKEIAEMKSDFVSSVSHELRTPLSSIKAYVEMLVDGEATDEDTRAEFYTIIQTETDRLQRLIDNILNISRIESGVVKVQREYISLPQLIHEVIDVMQPQAASKRIELTEVPTPLFFQVFADKDMVYQATLNLVGNAIKYTPEGGKVTVSISVDEHKRMVDVSVADTGLGIPAEDVPRLFDKFFRVNSHKKVAKGTGLGLSLVKHIVETVHHGEMKVTSVEGEGSTFTFSLPMADRRGNA